MNLNNFLLHSDNLSAAICPKALPLGWDIKGLQPTAGIYLRIKRKQRMGQMVELKIGEAKTIHIPAQWQCLGLRDNKYPRKPLALRG
jgi:hypothetical protein